MPQITMEYSGNLAGRFDPRALALRIHELLPPLVETELESCKTRLVEHPDTVIADGAADRAMVHVDLRILSGRSAAQKTALGEAAMAALAEAVGAPAGLRVQLTVEVRDLDRENYHKRKI